MKKLTLLMLLITIVFNLGCNSESVHDKDIILQQQWYANSGFAGEVWAQEYLAKSKDINFKVVPGSDQIVTTQVVISGKADFGVAGADQIMLANENGADLVVVGVINHRTLAAYISNIENQIFTPADFAGKRVGTMEGTPVDFVYRVMMNVNHVNPSDLTEVPTNWTYVGFGTEYDIYPAFLNDEPITFAKERPDLRLSIIKPEDFGVNFIGTVYFCKRELIESNPEKVQAFINLMIEGWEQAISDPAKAIEIMERANGDIDPEKELKSLITGLEYYKGQNGMILFADKSLWNQMAQQLKAAKLIKHFNYDEMVNNNFVNWYHINDEKN